MLRFQVRVLRTIFPKPVMFCSGGVTLEPVKERKPISVLQKLSKEFIDVAPVVKTVKEDGVRDLHFDEWRNRIYVMKRYHFTNLQCFQMISRYPLLLKIPLSKFEKTVGQWFSADLGVKNFHWILLNQPILFDIDANVIKSRLPKFRALFRSSTALAELLINCPNVMFDNSEALFKKLDFLVKEKCFKMGEISKACALSKSLDFIKFRLDLLEKCGIYKTEKLPPHKINKYDKSRHKNPCLKDILLTNTENFTKIAKISTEEYAVCRDLFMASENNEYDSDDDDDDDDDDEVPYAKPK